MPSVQRTFDVNAPLDQVFDYLADFTHTEQWDPGTVSTTRLDTASLSVGARFRNVSEFFGRRTELEYVLRVLDHGRHLVFVGTNKTATATDDLTFTGSARSTTITYRATFEFKGIAKFAGPFVKPALEKLADKTIKQLRETLEAL
jgi:carbon monoxide dehydrogenase subunit G